MSVTMALTVRVAQHWLKLLPAVMSLVQGHMYDSGVQMYVSFNVLSHMLSVW
jgi:hypothetical protein